MGPKSLSQVLRSAPAITSCQKTKDFCFRWLRALRSHVLAWWIHFCRQSHWSLLFLLCSFPLELHGRAHSYSVYNPDQLMLTSSHTRNKKKKNKSCWHFTAVGHVWKRQVSYLLLLTKEGKLKSWHSVLIFLKLRLKNATNKTFNLTWCLLCSLSKYRR